MTRSARARFVFTVGMNLLRAGLSFTTGMLIARWLGPSSYGNMAFLLGTFAGVRSLLDMGSSAAFFTFLSQRPRSIRFVRGFFLWLLAQFLVPSIVVGLLLPDRWVSAIWHGEPRTLVLLAFAAAFMQLSVWPIVQQTGESQRRTYLVQGIGVVVVVAHIVAMALLWWFGMLGLYAILGAVALEYLLASAVALGGLTFLPERDHPTEENLRRKYLRYCLPLLPLAAVGFANEFVDRWLLQQYGGGVQQAYYAVGAQIASIALIATSSILSIFWKEIAEANHQGNHGRTQTLYRRVTRLLFFVGAALAGLLIPWSEDLLRMLLGTAYVGGATTLMIMMLYPIHQSMGQIGATMLYATERVPLQVAVSVGTVLLGTMLTYLFLAPPTARVPGLGLASTGLALKMVGTQILAVNVLAFAIARTFKWPFDWTFQPATLLGCVALGWVAHAAGTLLVPASVPLLGRLAGSAVLYAAMVAAFVYIAPQLAGLTRDELVADARLLGSRLARNGVP